MKPDCSKLVAALVVLSGAAVAAENPQAPSEDKAKALVAQFTLDEKVEQLLNVAPAIPRLGVPAYNWWTESLHGALGPVPTTNFPEPVGLAATFDEALLHDVAAAISVEVRALHTLGRTTGHLGRIGTGLNTWSPNINIFRDPRWGRGQETYGEDPFLTARMGVAYVRGMQGPDPDKPDVIASPKHYAVHSGPESTRHEANVYATPHDLEDTYLPAFRAAIVEGRAGSIMCAYNRVNGQPACVSDLLLKERLRGSWNFQGYVVSDCDAVRDVHANHKYAPDPSAAVAVALKAGVDNECNTATLSGASGLGDRYKEAYERGLIGISDIDRALIRLFSARYRNGDLPGLEGREVKLTPLSAIGSREHGALALTAAQKSLVLLKNDGVLPFKGVKRIAVIGPLADATRVLRGNYSSPQSGPPISLFEGLRRALPGVQITLAPGAPSVTDGDPIPTSALRTPDGKPGLRVDYYEANENKPKVSRIEPNVAARGQTIPQLSDNHRVVWSGYLVPPETGTYRIGLGGTGGELMFDDKVLTPQHTTPWGTRPELKTVELQKQHRYPIRITSEIRGADFAWKRVSAHPEEDFKAATSQADVIVAAVGLTSDLEGEEMKIEIEGFSGGDKTSIDLPAEQRKLLEQAHATGKPVIVVLMNGSTLDLSWAKANAAAIIEAWYPGQSGGLAIANTLTGKANPAGRLPLTFYRSVADLPPFSDYTMNGRTYRYFSGEPVYPFGYGLSYSSFQYGALDVQPIDGTVEHGLRVTTTLTNTSKRAGEEVAQLYLQPPKFEGAPRLALRGFKRISLQPGERKSISFALTPRDLSFVTRDGARQIFSGEHVVTVGSGQPDTGVTVQASRFNVAQQVSIAE